MGRFCQMGTEFQFYEMKRPIGTDGGDGRTAM